METKRYRLGSGFNKYKDIGTTNYIPKFTSSSAIGNSILQESGGTLVSTGRYVVNTSTSAGVSDINDVIDEDVNEQRALPDATKREKNDERI